MLMQFEVTNFMFIKNKITLSMERSADHSLERVLLKASEAVSLLPVAAIYGADSAGKTNVLLAIRTMQSMITGENAQLLKEKSCLMIHIDFWQTNRIQQLLILFFITMALNTHMGFRTMSWKF